MRLNNGGIFFIHIMTSLWCWIKTQVDLPAFLIAVIQDVYADITWTLMLYQVISYTIHHKDLSNHCLGRLGSKTWDQLANMMEAGLFGGQVSHEVFEFWSAIAGRHGSDSS